MSYCQSHGAGIYVFLFLLTIFADSSALGAYVEVDGPYDGGQFCVFFNDAPNPVRAFTIDVRVDRTVLEYDCFVRGNLVNNFALFGVTPQLD